MPSSLPGAGGEAPVGGDSAAAPEDDADVADQVLVFAEEGAYESFLRAPDQAGCRLLERSDELHSVRIEVTAPALHAEWLAQNGEDVTSDENVLLRVPLHSYRDTPPPTGPSLPFRDRALGWLGVPEGAAGWGGGVRVAVLDTYVGDHPALEGLSVTRLDLVESDVGESNEFAGHGTAVASLLAGASEDVRGVAPYVELLAVRVLDDQGTGDAFSVARGIVRATDAGAEVIGMSFGADAPSRVIEEAVAYARDQGVVLVAAAGNDGVSGVYYPARYPGVIAVGAVDPFGERAAHSNAGPELDVLAPGTGVWAAWSDGETVEFTGTSAAVPFVAGAIAALLSTDSSLTPDQAADTVVSYTNDNGLPGRDAEYGAGVLDIGRVWARDTEGIVDLAAAGQAVDNAASTNGVVQVLISAQNRGTVSIPGAKIETSVGPRRTEALFGPVSPGATVTQTVLVPLADGTTVPEALPIITRVSITGMEDGKPGNDVRRSSLTVLPRAAAP